MWANACVDKGATVGGAMLNDDPRGATRREAPLLTDTLAGIRDASIARPAAPDELGSVADAASLTVAAAVAAMSAGTDVALADRNTDGRGSGATGSDERIPADKGLDDMGGLFTNGVAMEGGLTMRRWYLTPSSVTRIGCLGCKAGWVNHLPSTRNL